jgi:hypothetical protein
MLRLLMNLVVLYVSVFCARRDHLLENLAPWQQLNVLKQQRLQPQFGISDRPLGVMSRQTWQVWKHALQLVESEAVVCCHRAAFKLY